MSHIRIRLRHAGAVAVLALCPVFTTAQKPPDRDAVERRITAHAAKEEMPQALSAYDGYVSAVKKPDVELLRPVAVGELQRLARNYPDDGVLYSGALERLARGGNAEALGRLKRTGASGSSPVAVESIASLARLGSKDAARRLGEILKSEPAARVGIIRAIEESDARSQAPGVAALLNDADVNVRRAAARAVGVLQHRDAIPQLRGIMERDVPIVQMFAAPALKRLGDTSADPFVAKMLASDSPEMRLEAAQAYPQTLRAPWIERVKGLRADRDGLARVRAADVLACCDPATARAILNEALRDPIPPMRVEAARVYELTDLADAAIARRLLGDSFDHVRLHGAGAVLRQIAKRAAKK